MRKPSIFQWILIALVATAPFGLSPHNEVFAKEKIRMGYLQSDLHQLAAFVALEKGYFRDEGLDVEVAGVFKAGPELMSAFASKDLDFGYVGEAPATIAVANKVADVKIIAQVNLEGSAIVVRKGSDIKRLENLVGKTVAVPGYANVQDFLLRKALTDNRIVLNSVATIVIKPPEMIPALDTKQIDAFVAWEPYPAKAITSSVGEILIPSGKIWPNHPCCALVADTQFVAKNPEAIRAILRSHVKATKFIKENPDEATTLGVKFTGMDRETIKLGMKNLTYEYVPDVQGLLDYVTFLQELGQIKNVDPKNFVKDFVRKNFLEEILSGK